MRAQRVVTARRGRVAVADQVGRDHRVGVGEPQRHRLPVARGVHHPVDQDHGRPAARPSGRSPGGRAARSARRRTRSRRGGTLAGTLTGMASVEQRPAAAADPRALQSPLLRCRGLRRGDPASAAGDDRLLRVARQGDAQGARSRAHLVRRLPRVRQARAHLRDAADARRRGGAVTRTSAGTPRASARSARSPASTAWRTGTRGRSRSSGSARSGRARTPPRAAAPPSCSRTARSSRSASPRRSTAPTSTRPTWS